ncbi:hypothetical protein [Anaeromicropila herbilytica]|uniref:Uncharacterized protein n=1 Tax=Anaeromicropila herbilytica TaxID=2785025 RepID=A0A7R7ICN3_9FIRM|nr:hypothetical protein [Anaeromicropila herbilytica]BCN29168.1 hypothetical protein bsdtb5_04630 [Anaeromicropila herbilytica]
MKLTFSYNAVVVFILLMLPNIVYFISPPTDVPETLGSSMKLLGLIENIFRIISFLLLFFVPKNPNASIKSPWVIGIIIFMVLYFVLWGRYFFEGSTYEVLGKDFLGIPMPMVIFPIGCLICTAFWLDCIPAVIATIIFGMVHALSHFVSN